MKRPKPGTEQRKAFVVELGPGWRRWARNRSDRELDEINERLVQLVENFGQPHGHAGLGLRHLRENAFEFRIARGIRVVFLFFKPNRFQLMMTGNHDQVSMWLKENV